MWIKDYYKIKKFIEDNNYTYKIKDVLEDYMKYWVKGLRTSHTMTHCIESLENEIRSVLGLQ